MSGPISTAMPQSPVARPPSFAGVKRSFRMSGLSTAAHNGMVKAMIEARPAAIRLTP